MGAVYEAEHILIHRRVALKVLHGHVAQQHDALRRFEREAQAAGRIGSAHIVEVLDMGELGDGSRFIVMELLEGETLADRLRTLGRMVPEEAAPIACQVLAGLGAAHAADIVHRDLKPANVFLLGGRGDFVKILDFGVSKFSAVTEEMGGTSPGTAVGTPYYMSPEQAKGAQKIDHRSDLYAVGVLLYECVTGQVPFDAGTFNELIFRIVLESPPPLETFVPDADPAFVALVRKAMAREPGERFQTAREMYEALTQWLGQATGHAAAPGAVPWGAPAGPPPPRLAGAPTGPATDIALEHAPTLLREPRRKRSGGAFLVAGVLGVLVVSTLVLVAARSGPGRDPVAAAPSASAPVASPPAVTAPSASVPVTPASSPATDSAAPPTAPPPTTTAAHGTRKPARPVPGPTARPVTAPGRRTVSSEL
jgi:serine/threonine-protein kinase